MGDHEVARDRLRKAARRRVVPGRRIHAGRRTAVGLDGQHDIDRLGAWGIAGSQMFDEPPHGRTDGRLSEALQGHGSRGANARHRRRPWRVVRLHVVRCRGTPTQPENKDQDQGGACHVFHGLIDSGVEARFRPLGIFNKGRRWYKPRVGFCPGGAAGPDELGPSAAPGAPRARPCRAAPRRSTPAAS